MDEYQDFLRSTVAFAGNDHRLGANEARPPSSPSSWGYELTAVVDSIINGTNYQEPEKSVMRIGVDVLPAIPKDTTDRNRTSPLAFTGNKFEFRMLDPPSPFPARISPSTPSWPRNWVNLPTHWKRRRTSTPPCRPSSATP